MQKLFTKAAALFAAAALLFPAGVRLSYAGTTPDGLSLGMDAGVSATISLLQPDETYYFPVERTVDGVTRTLREEAADTLTLTVETGASLFDEAALTGWNGRTYLKLDMAGRSLRDGGTHTAQLTLTDADGLSGSFTVRAGLRQANSGSWQAGEPVEVKWYMPLYTVRQQMDLARLNGWRPVTFTGDGWSFTGTLTAQGVVDFSVDTSTLPAVRRYLDGAPAVYFGFPGGGNFENGKLTVDLSGARTPFTGTVYAYRYLYGRLYHVPAVYDPETRSITLSVTNLGRYVFTEERIPESTPVD